MGALKIPGYREAVADENLWRDAAFLLTGQRVAGMFCDALTPRHLLRLTIARNAFAVGGVVGPLDVLGFLWEVHRGKFRGRLAQFCFARCHRRLDFETAVNGIKAYLSGAMSDSPAVTGGNSVTYVSLTALIVHALASNYGWKEDRILDLPMTRVWQYLRCIQKQHDPDVILCNPSDTVRARALERRNRAMQRLQGYHSRKETRCPAE